MACEHPRAIKAAEARLAEAVRSDHSLAIVIADLNRFPQITPRETLEIGTKLVSLKSALEKAPPPQRAQIEQEIDELACRLAFGNWRLVTYTIYKLSGTVPARHSHDLTDLFQVGLAALHRAATRWDPWHESPPSLRDNPDTATAFSTFAVTSIRYELLRAQPQFLSFPVGPGSFQEYLRYRKTARRLREEGHNPTHPEIVLRMKLNRLNAKDKTGDSARRFLARVERQPQTLIRLSRRVQKLINAIEHTRGLEDETSVRHISEDGEPVDLTVDRHELIQDTETIGPEEWTDLSLLEDNVTRALAVLTPREIEVVRLKFGLDNGIELTVEEVAKILKTTPAKVNSILQKAILKLGHPTRTLRLSRFADN